MELHFVKAAVGGGFLEEFGVSAGVGDFALGHNNDEVGGENS